MKSRGAKQPFFTSSGDAEAELKDNPAEVASEAGLVGAVDCDYARLAGLFPYSNHHQILARHPHHRPCCPRCPRCRRRLPVLLSSLKCSPAVPYISVPWLRRHRWLLAASPRLSSTWYPGSRRNTAPWPPVPGVRGFVVDLRHRSNAANRPGEHRPIGSLPHQIGWSMRCDGYRQPNNHTLCGPRFCEQSSSIARGFLVA